MKPQVLRMSDVGPAGIGDDFISGGEKMAGHHFAVDEVFRAAEIDRGDPARSGSGTPRIADSSFQGVLQRIARARLSQG